MLPSTRRTAPRIAARPRRSARVRRLSGEGLSTTLENACKLGGWRGREKDTVSSRQRPAPDLPVVRTEQPCRVVERELCRAPPPSLAQVGPELRIGPEPAELSG